jgi:hypothetical protein
MLIDIFIYERPFFHKLALVEQFKEIFLAQILTLFLQCATAKW